MKKHLFVPTERRQGGFLNLNPQANSQQKVAIKSTEVHTIHRIHRLHRLYRVHKIHGPGSPVIFF
jgi:hypothetical protein